MEYYCKCFGRTTCIGIHKNKMCVYPARRTAFVVVGALGASREELMQLHRAYFLKCISSRLL